MSQTIHNSDFHPYTQGTIVTDDGTIERESTAPRTGKLEPIGSLPHTPKIMDKLHFQKKTDSARELLEKSHPMPDMGENSLHVTNHNEMNP